MTIVEGYIKLLDNLSPVNKLDLITKLTENVKSKKKNSRFDKSFGAFKSSKSADEIINEIKASRVFSRKIELF